MCEEGGYFKVGIASLLHERRELRMEMYLHQVGGGPQRNQHETVGTTQPQRFGTLIANDWVIFDGPDCNAGLVANAEGVHFSGSMTDHSWCVYFNMVFKTGRFKGSTLKILGNMGLTVGEWAIAGGTGEFALAQGVVTYKKFNQTGDLYVRKLEVRAFYTPLRPDPLAQRQSLVTKIGLWGENGGPNCDVREPPLRLTGVTICSGEVIYSLAFSYLDAAGRTHGVGPWGGSGGKSSTIQLGPSEYVQKVSGTTFSCGQSTVVTRLEIVTNKESLRCGSANGVPFSAPVQPNNSIVGFFANASECLNALGVYVHPSAPAPTAGGLE